MSCERFHISESNPNEQTGGGGCVCSPTKVDCVGPYAVFYACETDSNVSPHVVVSLACAEAAVRLATDGEVLAPTNDKLPVVEASDFVAELDEDDAPAL